MSVHQATCLGTVYFLTFMLFFNIKFTFKMKEEAKEYMESLRKTKQNLPALDYTKYLSKTERVLLRHESVHLQSFIPDFHSRVWHL